MTQTGSGHPIASTVEPDSLPDRIAWICLLAATVLVPLVTSLAVGRPWGFYALTEDPYHTPKLLTLAVLLTVATAAWLWGAVAGRRGLRFGPAALALGAFAILVAVSTVASPQRATSFFGASGLMTGAYTWLACLWAGVLLATYTNSSRRLLQLSRVVGATGAAVALLALLQSLRIDPLGTQVREDFLWMIAQGMATTGNPNYTGILLVVPSLVLLGLALAEQDRRWRIAAVVGAALTSTALFITLTRAAWIGLAVGVLAGVLLVPAARGALKRWAAPVVAFIVVAVAAGLYLNRVDVVAERFTSIAAGLEAFSSGRVTLWSDVFRVIGAHPLFGSGADRLGVAAYPYQSNVVTEGVSRFVLQDPHSMPILIAAIFGIPALVAFVVAVVFVVRTGLSQVRAETGSARMRVLYGSWVAGLIGLLAASLLSVTTITLIFITFVTLGVVAAPGLRRTDERLWPSVVVGALALGIAVIGLWGTWQSTQASYELVASRYAETERHLLRAIELAPWDSSIRSSYLSRKIGAMISVIQGDDAAASKQATNQIDQELQQALGDFPDELILMRLRILLHDAAKGRPGYQPQAHRAAIEDALKAYPNEEEFQRMLRELSSE